MNFLVVCRDEPHTFEKLIDPVEVRAVPTLDAFKGRRLKASETCDRAIVALSDSLVTSGWLQSSEWQGLLERHDKLEVELLVIRIGIAPCTIPDDVTVVREADARIAVRRLLAGQPVDLPRPPTAAPSEEQLAWANVVAHINLGVDPAQAIQDAGLTPQIAVGHVFQGRFRLLRDLGPDALFSNWHAEDLVEGSMALVRFVHPHEKGRGEQLIASLPTWAELEHPAISRVLDHGEHEGRIYFANSINGDSLAHAVAQGAIDGDGILLVTLEIADALAYAHAKDTVHGAVDPGRVHVGPDGQGLLADFGVGAVLRGSRDAVVYAAPETLAPDAVPEVGNDVYGLGMMILLGLHGEQLPYWVLRDANRLIDSLDVREPLETTLRAALDWVPNQRPSSVDALSHALLSDDALAVRLANRALDQRRLGTVERIVNDLDVRDANPGELSRLRMAVARVRAAEGDPQTAIATLTSLAEGSEDASDIWLELAQLHLDEAEIEQAVGTAERALETHSSRRQAIAALRLLVDHDPERFPRWARTLALYTDGNEKGEVSWRLGKVFHDTGDDAAALLWLDRAAAAGFQHPDLARLRKKIRAARGDWVEVARMMVDRASEADNPVTELEAAARIARRATSDPGPLVQIHERILEHDPDHADALRYLIVERTRVGDDVLELQERLNASPAATPGDHAVYARRLLALDRWQDALDAAQQALAKEPNHIVALRVAGRAAQDGGMFEQAREYRERLLGLQDSGATAGQADRLARLGDLSRFLGEQDRAGEYYDSALAIDPNHLAAWWGLYNVERAKVEAHGGIPGSPLRFAPHEGLARLFADLLEPQSIRAALADDTFAAALLPDDGAPPWRTYAAIVDVLSHREAIGPQLFDRLFDAFPERLPEISTVQGMFSGATKHIGTFPVAEACAWADDGPDFDAGVQRDLRCCSTWPAEASLLEPEFFETLFAREVPLEPREREADIDDDEDLLLESPEVPVLLIGIGENQIQIEVEADLELSPRAVPTLPGKLFVYRRGDQVYIAVQEHALDLGGRLASEARLSGGDRLTWQGVPIEFYRVQDPSTLTSPIGETTAPLPDEHRKVPGQLTPRPEAEIDPDVPAVVWQTSDGPMGMPLDNEHTVVVCRADGSAVFTTSPHDPFVAVLTQRHGEVFLEENLSHDSGFGGRLSARPVSNGETLMFGSLVTVFRAAEGTDAFGDIAPRKPEGRPFLILMDGSQNGRPIAISTFPFRLGRGRGCELQIRTDGLLSRVHCRIEQDEDGGLSLADAGSSNGTRLNGRTITNKPTPIEDGDRIEIGHTMLVFSRVVEAEVEGELDEDDATEEGFIEEAESDDVQQDESDSDLDQNDTDGELDDSDEMAAVDHAGDDDDSDEIDIGDDDSEETDGELDSDDDSDEIDIGDDDSDEVDVSGEDADSEPDPGVLDEEIVDDQDGIVTRTWLPDAIDTVAYDEDDPVVMRKVTVANRALAALAAALDRAEGPGRTRTELQAIIDARRDAFHGLFDGLQLDSHAIPWDHVDDALADRPARQRTQALSTGLIAFVDAATERVCGLLPPEQADAVLADLAVIGHRRELQF